MTQATIDAIAQARADEKPDFLQRAIRELADEVSLATRFLRHWPCGDEDVIPQGVLDFVARNGRAP